MTSFYYYKNDFIRIKYSNLVHDAITRNLRYLIIIFRIDVKNIFFYLNIYGARRSYTELELHTLFGCRLSWAENKYFHFFQET